MKITDKLKAKVKEPQQRTAMVALAAFMLSLVAAILVFGMLVNPRAN